MSTISLHFGWLEPPKGCSEEHPEMGLASDTSEEIQEMRENLLSCNNLKTDKINRQLSRRLM